MSGLTKWVNKKYWGYLWDFRQDVKKVLGELPENYGVNIISALHDRGEHRLANNLLEELNATYCGEPVKCHMCGSWTDFARIHENKFYCKNCN